MISTTTGGSSISGLFPPMTDTSMQGSNTSSGESIGMILPPPDIRSIIDKTAQFVAKNGLEFEQRVLLDRGGERKFSFLLPGNPYRLYYESKVKEYLTGEVDESTKPQIPQAIQEMKKREAEKQENREKVLALTAYATGQVLPGVADSPEEFLKLTETASNFNASTSKMLAIDDGRPLEPPSESLFIVTLPFAAAFDICDQVNCPVRSAEWPKFLAGLGQRERGNAQFAFLRATHPLFSYFTALVDAYARVLMPERNTIARLKEDIGVAARFSSASSDEFVKPNNDPLQAFPPSQTNALLGILERVTARYRWEEQEERKKQEKAKEESEDREQMHSLDWHEFVVVEAIQFTEEDELLPLGPPIDITQLTQPPVIAPMAPLESFVPIVEPLPAPVSTDTYVPMKSKDDGSGTRVSAFSGEPKQGSFSNAPGAEVNLPANAPIMVVSNYVRQPKKRSRMVEGMMKCPITGQMVSTAQMSDHLRILLLDPKWKEQKDALVAKARKESALALEGDFEANLANFVVMRPDLFGSVDDECESTYVQVQPQPT